MASKKSYSNKIAWLVFTLISGGGFSGYMKPELPIVGSLVEKIIARFHSGEIGKVAKLVQEEGVGEAISQVMPANHSLSHVQAQVQAQVQGGGASAAHQPASGRHSGGTLLIASFNIQVLGTSKMSKPGMPQKLATIIRHFDLVAIQEVRSKENNILPDLVSAINADGSRYSFLIGPRLGRSNSKEQYAFVFNTNTIEHDPSSVGTISDPSDLLHREPFVARFRARTQSPEKAFTFWMVDIHTDPDEVPQEVDALADVFDVMRKARADEDDVILLGDLNANDSQLGRLGKYPGIRWTVTGVTTNTRKTKAYDNILFEGQATAEYTGRWGVVDLESAMGINLDQALQISDHLPIWAEFQVWEATSAPSFADRTPNVRR